MKTNKLFFSLVSEFLTLYLPKQIGRSDNTVKSYCDALTLFRRFVNESLKKSVSNFTFEECNRECLLSFMQHLKELDSSDKTRNHRLAAIKSYMYFASDKDITLQSYALEVRRVPCCKEIAKVNPTLTEEGIKIILREPKNNKLGLRNKVFMILLYDTAVRLNELLSLKIEDIKYVNEQTTIKVLGKGSKERVLALTDTCVKHLKQYLEVYHGVDSPNTNLLFYTVIHGNINKISECTVERFIKLYADSARKECPEIPNHVYPHMFRSYRATQLYNDGVPLDVVSRLLGHSQLESTRGYAIPSQESLEKAINSIEVPGELNNYKLWMTKEDELAKLCGLR
jgi:site-specific recombinase XerD